MAISAINSFAPMNMDLLSGVGRAQRSTGTPTAGESDPGGSFADMVMRAMERLNTAQQTTDNFAEQAATGRLESIEDYMTAATESQLLTQITVAVRNKAVEAYNDIVRMVV